MAPSSLEVGAYFDIVTDDDRRASHHSQGSTRENSIDASKSQSGQEDQANAEIEYHPKQYLARVQARVRADDLDQEVLSAGQKHSSVL